MQEELPGTERASLHPPGGGGTIHLGMFSSKQAAVRVRERAKTYLSTYHALSRQETYEVLCAAGIRKKPVSRGEYCSSPKKPRSKPASMTRATTAATV